LLGESEQVILAGRMDGIIDVFSLRQNNERFYINFETKVNTTIDANNPGEIEPEFRLHLPTISSEILHRNNLIKLKKQIAESSNGRVYRIFSLDVDGKLIISETAESDLIDLHRSEKYPIKTIKIVDVKSSYNRIYGSDSLRFLDFDNSKQNQNIFILSNNGLLKESYEGSSEYILSELINNNSEGNVITAFSVSDTGHYICGFKDLLIRVYDERNNTAIFQTIAKNINPDSRINFVSLANVVCKNEKQKLERKDLIANIFVFSNNNDFLIYDLNQDIKDIKVTLI